MNPLGNFTNIYVSQTVGHNVKYNGLSPIVDDQGNGPVATLSEARALIGGMRVAGDMSPVTVHVMGDYYLGNENFVLDTDTHHAGTYFGGDNVVYEGMPDAHGNAARIIGGVKVKNWKEDTFRGVPCISGKVPMQNDGTYPFVSELFVNGRRADKTRYPKEGTLRARDTENNKWVMHVGSQWFDAFPEDLKDLENIENSTVNFYHFWVDAHTPIESYDYETGHLVMKYASSFCLVTQYEPSNTASLFYYLENVAQSFGDPGAYYYDRAAGTVYYVPTEPLDLETIEAVVPTRKQIVTVKGSDEKPVCDVTFRNLEFFCSSSDYASHRGGKDYASDVQSVCSAYGVLDFSHAHRCRVENCTFHGTGLHAVKLGVGCRSCRVEHNTFYDLGAGGVSIEGTAANQEGAPTHGNVIAHNTITGVGKRFAAACGILIRHSFENDISYNDISDTVYTGISAGWVWGYDDSTTYGNRIAYNHIHHIGNGLLSDLGGVYLLGKQPGTVVEYNRIHDINCAHYGGWGIYTDEGSSYIRIENNVVFRTKHECCHQHFGSYNVYRNNIFAFGGGCLTYNRSEFHKGSVMEHNILVVDGKPIFGIEDPRSPSRALYTGNNLAWDASGRTPICKTTEEREYTFEDWCALDHKGKGSIVADPLFKNAAEDDFTIDETSPAVSIGFKPIKGFPATDR